MQPVLVTTTNRGVYFGYLEAANGPEWIALTNARVAVEWDTEMRGFLALAADGPNDRCKISRPTRRITLFGVATVSECTDEAAERWELAPWSC